MLGGDVMLHLIYLKDALLLSKKHYAAWQQIQDEYDAYKTSLGPWPVDEVIEFFQADYGPDERRWPFSRQDIQNFVQSDQQVLAKS